VGDKKNLFLAASISTLVTKIVMLVVSVILVYHLPEKVHPSPFLLWCQSSWSDEALANKTLCTFEGINNTAPCFDINSNSQKVRQCAEDETIFMIIMILVILLSNLASLLATLRLHRLINYVALYKTSRALMCCGIQPIVHRAAVFQLIATNEDPELFDEIFKDGIDRSSIIDRPDSSGLTFLHAAFERKSLEKVKRLINARPHGADVNLANSSKQTPLHIACDKNPLKSL